MIGAVGYSLCDLEKLVKESEVIINATSVGMKEGDPRLIPGDLLQSSHAVFDIVYNRETELLKDARAAGALAGLNRMGISVHRSQAPTVRENLALLASPGLPLTTGSPATWSPRTS